MVNPAANTGKEINNKNEVTIIAHTKSGSSFKTNPRARILKIVTRLLITPNREEIPAKCKLKIAKSTDMPG